MTTEPVQKPRRTTALIAGAAGLVVIALFAVAFLVSHHGAPAPAAAKVVEATVKPGPNAAQERHKFVAKIGPLIKPVVHKKKKPTPAVSSTDSAAEATSASSEPVEPDPAPAPVYTPPATSSSSSSSSSSGGTKTTPQGGSGVITVG